MDDFKEKTFGEDYWLKSPRFNLAGKRLKKRLKRIARAKLKSSDRKVFNKYM